MTDADDTGNRSGGGIVFGGGSRASKVTPATTSELVNGLRRRWTTGVAIVTARDPNGGLRGVTVSAMMVVSQDPPVIAIALTGSSAFHELAVEGATLGVSVLDSDQEFSAERFAGRAPLPDAAFSGIAHEGRSGVPILTGSLGWITGSVASRERVGDHHLILLDVLGGELGPDTDDPLVAYEGRYRRLEAG